MKKTVGKPQNWQDFESLCKKLWGEVWQIPHTIKKNGRAGQPQCGVDVYGKPKGCENFYGIQCKGKDDYSDAVLTIKEIEAEIEKAKSFKPPLEVYVIATTANKDAKIEEYIRIKSLENTKQLSFEILIYCWEDIVDLMEEYPYLMDSYLNNINQKNRFDFKVSFNKKQDTIILRPKLVKEITKHIITNKSKEEIIRNNFFLKSFQDNYRLHDIDFLVSSSNRVNKSWVEFDLVMENIGNAVIEDYSFEVTFIEGVETLEFTHNTLLLNNNPCTYIDVENNSIYYRHPQNQPLVQKSNRYFEVSVLPQIYANKIVAEWELISRDFHKTGKFEIEVVPQYTEEIIINEMPFGASPKKDEVNISYLIE